MSLEVIERPGRYAVHYPIIAGYTGHGMPIAFGASQAIAQVIKGRGQNLQIRFPCTI